MTARAPCTIGRHARADRVCATLFRISHGLRRLRDSDIDGQQNNKASDRDLDVPPHIFTHGVENSTLGCIVNQDSSRVATLTLKSWEFIDSTGGEVIRLDHLAIPVTDAGRSRDWYTSNLGLKLEFEIAERKTVALRDDGDLTLFLYTPTDNRVSPSCTLAFQVDEVDDKYRELAARRVAFEKSPQKLLWGYGAELRDPDGYLIYLWDGKVDAGKGW